MTDVYLDERFIGSVSDIKSFINNLKRERRDKDFLNDLNIFYEEEFDDLSKWQSYLLFFGDNQVMWTAPDI